MFGPLVPEAPVKEKNPQYGEIGMGLMAEELQVEPEKQGEEGEHQESQHVVGQGVVLAEGALRPDHLD